MIQTRRLTKLNDLLNLKQPEARSKKALICCFWPSQHCKRLCHQHRHWASSIGRCPCTVLQTLVLGEAPCESTRSASKLFKANLRTSVYFILYSKSTNIGLLVFVSLTSQVQAQQQYPPKDLQLSKNQRSTTFDATNSNVSVP